MSNKVHVVSVGSDGLRFSDGTELTSDHESDCCEWHYLDFSDLNLEDFDGLEFDLFMKTPTGYAFFERIDGYGIALKPISGHPVRIPGYGRNNGYYSTNLTLILTKDGSSIRFGITECQDINWDG
jgi:hypothetical protein